MPRHIQNGLADLRMDLRRADKRPPSQRDIAQQVGIGIADYHYIESGRMLASDDELALLCEFFGVGKDGIYPWWPMIDIVRDTKPEA